MHELQYDKSQPRQDKGNEWDGMKDRSLLYLAAGGIAIWVIVGYPPAREAVFDAARHIARAVAELFH